MPLLERSAGYQRGGTGQTDLTSEGTVLHRRCTSKATRASAFSAVTGRRQDTEDGQSSPAPTRYPGGISHCSLARATLIGTWGCSDFLSRRPCRGTPLQWFCCDVLDLWLTKIPDVLYSTYSTALVLYVCMYSTFRTGHALRIASGSISGLHDAHHNVLFLVVVVVVVLLVVVLLRLPAHVRPNPERQQTVEETRRDPVPASPHSTTDVIPNGHRKDEEGNDRW